MAFLSALLGLLVLAPTARPQIVETNAFPAVNRSIPDGNAAGLSDRRQISSTISTISKVRVKLRITGEFNGDLYGYLRCIQGGRTNLCVLLNRPGRAANRLAGYADAGLDVTFDDAVPGEIHTYQTVTNLAAASPLVGTWRPDGRAANPATTLDTTLRTTLLSAFNGGDGSADWTLYLADLESGGTNALVSWQLEITGATRPPLLWNAPAAITYGTALTAAQLNATSSVAGSFSYNPPIGTGLNAGSGQSLSVTFKPTDTNRYTSVTTNVPIDILKAPLTVAAVSTNKVFGAALPALTVNYTGFVNGDTVTRLTSPAVATTAATTASAAGTYPVTASGAFASNYTFSYVSGTLTVNKASTTLALASSKSPSNPGDPVIFTATVNAAPPGVGVPGGSVQFKIDGVNAGAPVTLAGGTAQLTTSTLTAGSHSVLAEYAGNGNFFGKTNSLSPVQSVNGAPIAVSDTIERGATNSTKVLVSTLLANDSDPEGDGISLVSFTSTSTNGASIKRDVDWIIYTPAARLTVVDAFNYTIVDSHGAIALGTVVVRLSTDALPGQNLLIVDRGDGSYLIRFDGIPGVAYRIQANENLNIPNWLPLGSAVADSFGVFQFIDTPPGGAPKRYYRSVYP